MPSHVRRPCQHAVRADSARRYEHDPHHYAPRQQAEDDWRVTVRLGYPRWDSGYEPHGGMVYRMAQRKVTLSLPGHTVAAAQAAARQAGAPFSTYVARALRNETLRQQLAASPLPEDREWLDMAEADEAAGS